MILYFDTETTGLRPGQICQLTYIMQDGFGSVAKNFFFSVESVDYSAFLVHGFSVQKLYALSNGKVFSDFITEIAQDFANADLIIAHNIDFDLSFMRAEFERAGVQFKYKNSLCSMKTCVPICKLPRSRGVGFKYPKLGEMLNYFGYTDCDIVAKEKEIYGMVTSAHDARYDTVALYMAVNKATAICPEFSIVKECL
jgi:DNA polymerase-3 subunit epsilon